DALRAAGGRGVSDVRAAVADLRRAVAGRTLLARARRIRGRRPDLRRVPAWRRHRADGADGGGRRRARLRPGAAGAVAAAAAAIEGTAAGVAAVPGRCPRARPLL